MLTKGIGDKLLQMKKGSYNIKLTADSEIEEESLIAKDNAGQEVGRLGIMAYRKKSIPLRILPLIQNQNDVEKNKKRAKKVIPVHKDESENTSFTFSTVNLLQKLNLYYEPLGIAFSCKNIEATDPILCYNKKSEDYKNYFNGDDVQYSLGKEFTEKIFDANTDIINAFDGITILITDCYCRTYGYGVSTLIHGVGQLSSDICIIFESARINYEIYAHELAHVFDCKHTFYDDLVESEEEYLIQNELRRNWRIDVEKNSAVKDSELYDKEKKLPPDIDDYLNSSSSKEKDKEKIEAYREELKKNAIFYDYDVMGGYYDWKEINDENVNIQKDRMLQEKERALSSANLNPFLYNQKSTENILDYNKNYNYFFK